MDRMNQSSPDEARGTARARHGEPGEEVAVDPGGGVGGGEIDAGERSEADAGASTPEHREEGV